MNRKLVVSLTGGLGNQLFQYAALLYFGKGRSLGVNQDLGKPRVQSDGRAELLAFNLNCEVVRLKKTLLSEKFSGYLLRLGVFRKWWEIRPLMRMLAEGVGSSYLSLVNRSPIRIQGYDALGYSESFSIRPSTNLVVGYFQNEKWVISPPIWNELMRISLKEIKPSLRELIEEARREKPLVVHVRLGDYRKEEMFGILPQDYYHYAIKQAWSINSHGVIWLFSDEPNDALYRIPQEFQQYVRVIDPFYSPAECLELMRYGAGYVIANSTFSWWGAMLSYKRNPVVFAPQKWFRYQSDPENLIPDDWERVRSW